MQESLTTLKTACTRDCPDACGLIATVENGRVIRLQGDPDHPVTQGFICKRTSRFVDRQYSPHRLTRPLFRRSVNDDFEEITWDEALDLAAEHMLRFRNESGGAALLNYRCGGSLGILKHVGDYFFERFGPVTTKSGDVCAGAGEAAQLLDFGEFDSSDYFTLHDAKTIFLWGKNVFISSIHLIPELKKARANGTRIVVIDPIHTRTADIADLCVQPRPGTDSAIALGIARWLLDNDQWDTAADSYCDHLPQYRELVRTHSADEWAALADISPTQLRELAVAYAEGPTCSMIGWGLQRRRHGAATIRTIDALAAVSGNLGVRGGGASFYFVRRGAFDCSFSNAEPAPRQIPEPLLGPGILAASDPPIRMAWVWAANPVAMLPDSGTVAQALKSREFTVVVDPFLTDTALCAHLVLPTTTMLEEDDVIGSYGHHYLARVNRVVAPPDGVLSDYDIFRQLSRRVGLADEFDIDSQVWRDRLLGGVNKTAAGAELSKNGFARNPFVADVLFADRKFPTPSGKVNLIRQLHPDLLQEQPVTGLLVTALSTSDSQASQWPHESQVGPATAIVHPSAAADCADGAVATLKTARSSLSVRLQFDDRQRPDVVLMEKGHWHSQGRSANALIEAELTDDGQCAVYYDTAAVVEPERSGDRSL